MAAAPPPPQPPANSAPQPTSQPPRKRQNVFGIPTSAGPLPWGIDDDLDSAWQLRHHLFDGASLLTRVALAYACPLLRPALEGVVVAGSDWDALTLLRTDPVPVSGKFFNLFFINYFL